MVQTKEEKKAYRKEYQQIPEVKRKRNERNKIFMKEYNKRPLVKKHRKKYLNENAERISRRRKIYNAKNRKHSSRTSLVYYHEHKHEFIRKFTKRLRGVLNQAFLRYSKTGKIYSSKKYGINYGLIIENLKPFPKDIKNYNVDHIIPLSRFDWNNPKHIKIAFSPENHQWLTKEENNWKRDKLIMPH